ncbi:hypothetical protein AEQ63_11415 [Pseudomonas sp. RIT-PI-o]|nr:hypothetical protein AEQ63_11415 [Pseudomonas sp. RIT-PI-o]
MRNAIILSKYTLESGLEILMLEQLDIFLLKSTTLKSRPGFCDASIRIKTTYTSITHSMFVEEKDFKQLVELRHAEAFADIGFEQTRLFALGQAVGAFELNVLDGETATIGGGRRLRWSGVFAGQVLEFFETPLLLFEQTVLTFADQVGFAGGGRSPSGFKRRKAEQSQAQPRREGG